MARVLIVDELPDLAAELAEAVPSGHDVTIKTSMFEAIQLVKLQSIDLIVSSLVLEAGDFRDGLAIIQSARETNPAVQAIIVASYSTPKSCQAALRARVFDYLERNSPGIAFGEMLRWKIAMVLSSQALASSQ